jgi:hypothetical protein
VRVVVKETHFRSRSNRLIVIAMAMLIWTIPVLAASTSALNRSMTDVQTGLGKLLGCQWQGTEALAVCSVRQIKGVVNLARDPADKTVETVELNALVAGGPTPRPDEEKLSRETVFRIVAYLLPTWKKGPEWLANALKEATHVKARKIIKVDGATVLVQWLQPADIDDTFATIVITKKASLDEWKWGDEDGER